MASDGRVMPYRVGATQRERRWGNVPLPVRICAHLADPFLADLRGKQRAKPVPPESNRLVADLDAAFVQQILHVP